MQFKINNSNRKWTLKLRATTIFVHRDQMNNKTSLPNKDMKQTKMHLTLRSSALDAPIQLDECTYQLQQKTTYLLS